HRRPAADDRQDGENPPHSHLHQARHHQPDPARSRPPRPQLTRTGGAGPRWPANISVMTTAMDRVRAARHWSFIMPGTADALRGEAARLQDLGVTGAMVPQIFGPPWAALGVIAASSDLEIGSGIAMGFVRSPLETAMAALDLDKISGGRLTLGLGTSVREWNEDRFGVPYERPLARLRELVRLVHQMVTAAE